MIKLKIILLSPCLKKKKIQKQTAKEYPCQSYFMFTKLAGLNVMSLSIKKLILFENSIRKLSPAIHYFKIKCSLLYNIWIRFNDM